MNNMENTLKRYYILSALLMIVTLGNAGCGYRVRSSVRALPEDIESLGIPTFINRTSQYKLEQWITGAVLKEFNARTRVQVHSTQSDADAVLLGEILSVHSTPIAYSSRSFGSAFMVTVQISAKMIRLKDSKVIWQNKNFTFRERYALNSDVRDFFFEENPALDRLAKAFAASLVSTIIESQSLDSPKP
jgi:hypothetical protein